jgi:hypothetical protein
MIDDNNVIPLFAVPLCKTKIDEPVQEIQDYLKNQIKFVRRQYSDADNSEELHVLNNDICKPLKDILTQKMNEFLEYLDVDLEKHTFYITTSWMNRYSKEQWSDLHYHSNSLISGVLYFDDCEDTSDIVFYKRQGLDNIFSDTVNIDHRKNFDTSKKAYLYHQRKLNVSPEQWDLIMFPRNQNVHLNKKRYSLAFNSFATGQLGSSSSIMFLDKNKKYD